MIPNSEYVYMDNNNPKELQHRRRLYARTNN